MPRKAPPKKKPQPPTSRKPTAKPRTTSQATSQATSRATSPDGSGSRADAGSRDDPGVTAFLRDLKHPRQPELAALRQMILGASPEIREGIKWNAPSFRTTDWFATTNVHAKDSLRLILHTGAKVKGTAKTGLKLADPSGLLKWLAPDRALVTFRDGQDFKAKRAPLQAVLREWVRQL